MRGTRFFLMVLMSFLIFTQLPAGAADELPVLTLDECLDIAISRHPDLAAAGSDVEASRARVGQSRTAVNPSIGFSTGYSRSDSPGSGVSGGSWSSSLTLSQLLSDWGRTHASVRKSILEMESASLALRQGVLDVVYQVKRSYFQLLKAEKNLEAAKETLALNDVQLDKAKVFLDVGRVSKYDVTAAQVSRSNANLALIQAETARKEAMMTLRTSMGFTDAVDFLVEETGDGKADRTGDPLPSLDEAVRSALENRPDLLAYRTKIDLSRASLTLAKLANAPRLSVSGSYGWGSRDFFGSDTWRAGMTLSLSLYDGGLQREKENEALAALEGTEARYEALRQSVVSEVTQALFSAEDSIEAVAAAAEGLSMALENLEIATGRYQVGVGSSLEISDATKNYSQAMAAWYAVLYDRMIYRAALDKAMGGIVR